MEMTQPTETFVRDVQEQQSPFTRQMNNLFGLNPAAFKQQHAQVVDALRPAGSLNGKPFPGPVRNLLVGLIGESEVQSLEAWDTSQREEFRAKLIQGIDGNIPMYFSWGMNHLGRENLEIDVSVPGRIKIRFTNPWSRITVQDAGSTIVDNR